MSNNTGGSSSGPRHPHHHSRGSHTSQHSLSNIGAGPSGGSSLAGGASTNSPASAHADITNAFGGGTQAGPSSGPNATAQIISAGTPTSVPPALAAAAGHAHSQSVLGLATGSLSASAPSTGSAIAQGPPVASLNVPSNAGDTSTFSIHGGGSFAPTLPLPGASPSQGTASGTGGGAGGPSGSSGAYVPPHTDPRVHAYHRAHIASLSFMSHMSKAMLQGGVCSDVIIAAFGREYKLHKIVLVQAGFFNTMFCGGFSEAEALPDGVELAQPAGAAQSQGSRFDVHFPDPNMSRPAFEFCLATLYGCAPTLKLPGWANPKAESPLGDPYPDTSGTGLGKRTMRQCGASSSGATTARGAASPRKAEHGKQKGRKGKSTQGHRSPVFDVSFGTGFRAGESGLFGQAQSAGGSQAAEHGPTQWATPRFLLSLIATSTYLGVPSVTSLAYTLILSSITPFTVSAYLRFASGLGIVGPLPLPGPADDDGSPLLSSVDELDAPLVGWERLSKEDASAAAVPAPRRGSGQASIPAQSGRAPQTQSSAPSSSPVKQSSVRAPADLTGSVSLINTGWYAAPEGTSTQFDWGASSGRSLEASLANPKAAASSHTDAEEADAAAEGPVPERNMSEDSNAHSPMGKLSSAPLHRQEASAADTTQEDDSGTDGGQTTQLFYGPSCDKIGEACVSWLCRWGGDVLEFEINAHEGDSSADDSLASPSIGEDYMSTSTLQARDRRVCRDDDSDGDVSEDSEEHHRATKPGSQWTALKDGATHPPTPLAIVWAYSRSHGLPSDIVREVISSDSFFVKSEWARYTLACDCVEFRRRGKEEEHGSAESKRRSSTYATASDQHTPHLERDSSVRSDRTAGKGKSVGEAAPRLSLRTDLADTSTSSRISGLAGAELDEDEAEYSELFARGIYYTHMSFSELSAIAEDISPATGSLYVPEHVLQKALWSGMEFRNIILQSNDRNVDRSQLGTEDPDTMLMTGLTVKEDILCDLHLASDLETFRKDFLQQPDVSASWLSPKRRDSPAPGSPSSRLAKRRPSNVDVSIRSDTLGGSLGKKSVSSKRFFPVPSDDTLRLGDALGSLISATLQVRDGLASYLVDTKHASRADPTATSIGASGLAALRDPYTLSVPVSRRLLYLVGQATAGMAQKPLANYFGIGDYSRTGKELAEKSAAASAKAAENAAASESLRATPFSMDDHLQSGGEGKGDGVNDKDEDSPSVHREMWLPFEPMRIGVDFWGVDKLAERNRLYSPTFFYAGSLWNLYVQTMRKPKGIQLGIYLHRQNPAEPLPPASAPPSEAAGTASSTRVNAPSLDQLLNESLNLAPAGLHSDTIGGHTPRGSRGAGYGASGSGGQAGSDEQPPTVPATMPAMPYRDPRKGVRAFFSIHCPSPLGSALTRFSSGPDQFTLSQSWGWKSSSLLGTVFLADGHIEDVRSESASRFRCVCTIGLI